MASQPCQTGPTAIAPPAAGRLLERPQGLQVGALCGDEVTDTFRGEPQLIEAVPASRVQRGRQGVLSLCPLVLAQAVKAQAQLIDQIGPGHPLSRVQLKELERQFPITPGTRELGWPFPARLAAGSLAGGGEADGGGGPIAVTVGDEPLLEELLRAELINVGQGLQGAPGRPVQAQVKLSLKDLAQPGGIGLVLGQTGEQNLQTLPLRGALRQAGEQLVRVAPVSHPGGDGAREEDGGCLRFILSLEKTASAVEGLSAGGVAVSHLGVGSQSSLELLLALGDDSQTQADGGVVGALGDLFIQALGLCQVAVLILPCGGITHQPGDDRQPQAARDGAAYLPEDSILARHNRPCSTMHIL